MLVFSRWISHTLALAVVAAFVAPSGAQVRYGSGQNVAPVYEGWERNADGSINMVFGYMNRNYEEEVEVPIGSNNRIEPGRADQGQPTHFYTRRQEFVFKVKVPGDWGTKELVWTLTSAGKTEKAYGVLTAVWEIGSSVYQQNRGGPGPGDPENQAPTVEMVGSAQRTAAVGEPLTLAVQVSDDGLPSPRVRPLGGAAFGGSGRRGAAPSGARTDSPIGQAVVKLNPGVRLGVTWIVYRGEPGPVSIEPMRAPVVSVASQGAATSSDSQSGKATTQATFSLPGVYVLRAYADDGILTTPQDVTVTVQAGTKP
jgi:hypothetical protein